MEERFVYVLIFSMVIYAIGIMASIRVVQVSIDEYLGTSYGIVPKKMVRILERNKELFVIFGSIMFPLYYCFRFGFFIGKMTYGILTDDNYEDRVASWVV